MCYVRQGSRALLTPKRFSLGRAPETEEHRLVPWYVGGVTFWSFFFFFRTLGRVTMYVSYFLAVLSSFISFRFRNIMFMARGLFFRLRQQK